MKLAAFLIFFGLVAQAQSNDKFLFFPDRYISGQDYYKNLATYFPNNSGINFEKGDIEGFLEVPLDYDHPEKGTMPLFYKAPKGIDQNKPSVMFFNGGPGGNSNMYMIEKKLTDFNLIYIDQRGTGFSHLPTYEQQLNPEYFSSEFIARDAEKVLTYLGVTKFSVWGHSYGTIVATIIANLFPERVNAVLLEGTIYDGTSKLWMAPHRVKILQRFFDKLPAELKEKILALSASGKVHASWFSIMAQSAMYSSDFEFKYKLELEDLLAKPIDQVITTIAGRTSPAIFLFDTYFMSGMMFHQIACQELSRGESDGTMNAEFVNGKLVSVKNPSVESCKLLPGIEKRMPRTYRALNYPLNMPVTYIQGTKDGATTAEFAIRHYKNVAKKSAQLVLVKNEGHSPAVLCLVSAPKLEECGNAAAITDIVRTALLGKELKSEQILKAGNSWKYTKKGWKP